MADKQKHMDGEPKTLDESQAAGIPARNFPRGEPNSAN
jgi:hypothetical protein